jgi:hypothetical protein
MIIIIKKQYIEGWVTVEWDRKVELTTNLDTRHKVALANIYSRPIIN